MSNTLLESVVKKNRARLIPFMLALYVLAFLDRSNIGFAKETYQLDTGLSNEAYALGAGIFFVVYAFLGVPANLLMRKFGARKWIGCTTLLWGILSAAMAWADTEAKFLLVRTLLGAAEAGFFPGMIYLTSQWFPQQNRASIMGLFYMGAPLALTLGSPLSGALLEMHGFLGKPGWFWMFFIEGIPAVIMGIFAWFWLDDTPAKARFLNEEEKKALIAQLQQEQRQTETSSVGTALKSLKVWHLALIYGTIQISVYGLMFFLPSQVASLMGSTLGFKESLVAAIPWACSAVGVYYIPRLADKMPARRVLISVICMLAAALGLFVSAWSGPVLAIAALSLSAIGFLSVQPIFWTFPAQIVSGSALAASIGFCTTMGAFCSFLAPLIRVEVDTFFGNDSAGLVALSLITVCCALLIAALAGRKATNGVAVTHH